MNHIAHHTGGELVDVHVEDVVEKHAEARGCARTLDDDAAAVGAKLVGDLEREGVGAIANHLLGDVGIETGEDADVDGCVEHDCAVDGDADALGELQVGGRVEPIGRGAVEGLELAGGIPAAVAYLKGNVANHLLGIGVVDLGIAELLGLGEKL